MKKCILCIVALFMAFASTAMAYTINIRTDGIQYSGSNLGSDMAYRVNGQLVGYGKRLGNDYIYTDAVNNRLGRC